MQGVEGHKPTITRRGFVRAAAAAGALLSTGGLAALAQRGRPVVRVIAFAQGFA